MIMTLSFLVLTFIPLTYDQSSRLDLNVRCEQLTKHTDFTNVAFTYMLCVNEYEVLMS